MVNGVKIKKIKKKIKSMSKTNRGKVRMAKNIWTRLIKVEIMLSKTSYMI